MRMLSVELRNERYESGPMKKIVALLFGFALCVGILATAAIAGPSQSEHSSTVWVKTLGEAANARDSIRGYSASPSLDGVWVLGGSEVAGSNGGYADARPFVWFIETSGAQTVVPLQALQKQLSVPSFKVHALLGLETGKVLLVIEAGQKLALARLNVHGEVDLLRPLEGYEQPAIRRIIQAADGAIYLIGNEGAHGSVARLNSDLNQVWKNQLVKVRAGEFVDGVAVSDGVIVVAHMRANEATSPRSFWIGKISVGGDLKEQKFKLGEFGGIAASSSSTLYIVLNQGTPENQDIRMQVWSSSLQEQREVQVTTGGTGMSHFYVSTLGSDEVVVAGTRFAKVWAKAFDRHGTESWKFEGTWDDEMLSSSGLAPLRDGVMVFGPVIKLRNDMWNIDKIGVMKLKAN